MFEWFLPTHEDKVRAFYSFSVQGLAKIDRDYLNFGLWENGNSDYHRAAENLIDCVAKRVSLNSKSVLLDVACGVDGEARFLMEKYHCQSIDALDLTNGHIEIAKQRNPYNNIKYRWGNACDLPYNAEQFSHIIGVEGIAHFNSRAKFFREANKVLIQEGKLGLSDICLIRKPENALERKIVELGSRAWLIPRTNVDTMKTYRRKLERSGFGDVKIESVRDKVFGGYMQNHLEAETVKLLYKIRGPLLVFGLAADIIAHTLYKMNLIDYIIVNCHKVKSLK